jgi:hypothetical protein
LVFLYIKFENGNIKNIYILFFGKEAKREKENKINKKEKINRGKRMFSSHRF